MKADTRDPIELSLALVRGCAACGCAPRVTATSRLRAAWCAVSVLGWLGAPFGRQQTLHDLLTKTRVLVDTRYR